MFTKNKRIDEQNDLIELVVDFELTVSTGETFLDRYLQS